VGGLTGLNMTDDESAMVPGTFPERILQQAKHGIGRIVERLDGPSR
jgi:hypothetical protein